MDLDGLNRIMVFRRPKKNIFPDDLFELLLTDFLTLIVLYEKKINLKFTDITELSANTGESG